MSKAWKDRRARRWARYYNHYGHIPSVTVGGWAAVRAVETVGPDRWVRIRRQGKPFGSL